MAETDLKGFLACTFKKKIKLKIEVIELLVIYIINKWEPRNGSFSS